MKLSRFKVENHERLEDFDIEVRDHLVLVGANDVGKSSLLRCLDLLLGASTAQLYSHVSSDDFRNTGEPFVIEATLSDFTEIDKALFPDEIHVDPATQTSRLVIRMIVTVDENDTIIIDRSAPEGGTSRQLSRDQLLGLGWKFLSAMAQTRDLREDRKSALDDMLQTIDLGDEKASFEAIAKSFTTTLDGSAVLKALRGSLADQLSRALPEKMSTDELAFVPGSAADEDVLSDVRLQINKNGFAHSLSEQSDGTRGDVKASKQHGARRRAVERMPRWA